MRQDHRVSFDYDCESFEDGYWTLRGGNLEKGSGFSIWRRFYFQKDACGADGKSSWICAADPVIRVAVGVWQDLD